LERIMRGISYTQEAVAGGSPDLLIVTFKKGFNANLCETLVDLLQTVEEADTE